jgi:predicted ABC-type ATPase
MEIMESINTIEINTSDKYYNSQKIFYGKYQTYRQMMDYDYYNNFTEERQQIQDNIIDEIILNINSNHKNLWIIYTMGSYGSGKTHTLHNINFLNLNEFVHIDPDKIKEKLPEVNEYTKLFPNSASTLLHKESCFIALLLEYYCILNNIPIIVDGSLQAYEWYLEHIKFIRENYKSYKICIIKVESELEIALERCKKREKITFRKIPEHIIKSVYDKIPISYEKLKDKVDLNIIVNNNKTPIIKNIVFNNI